MPGRFYGGAEIRQAVEFVYQVLGKICINLFGGKDDKYPMLVVAGLDMAGVGMVHYGYAGKSFWLVLELLAACGMILRARLRSSLAVGRCHRPLSSSVHYSSV